MLSESQYNNLMENLFLRSNKKYYNELMMSINQLKNGLVQERQLLDDEK